MLVPELHGTSSSTEGAVKTKTHADVARRIFYSQADEGQRRQGYRRIHNAARQELARERVNGKGRRLLVLAAWAAYLEGWNR